LARPPQRELGKPHLHREIAGVRGNCLIGRKQGQAPLPASALVECFDRAQPRFFLAVVDLAQIEHMTIDDSTPSTPALLRDAPIAVFLAVFASPVALEVHARK
jgi:hypothetical protein